MQTRILPLLVLASALLSGGVRAAQTAEPHPEKRGACKADVASLCKGIEKGEGRHVRCLAQNIDQIKNTSCKTHVQEYKTLDDAVKQACSAETDANCKGMALGTGLLKCLHKNKKTLSEGCKTVLHANREARKAKQGSAPQTH
ncbi:MAG: hypothetical protein AAB268_13635 [Elusimicrobiota bacterium]